MIYSITELAKLHFKKKLPWQEIERQLNFKPGTPTENTVTEDDIDEERRVV